MIRALLIIALAVGVIVGGLLALRRSGRAGMPSEEVLKRATRRARALDEEDEKKDP